MWMWYIKLWKKSWTWYSNHVTSYSPNMLNGVSRHGSPFTRQFADPKWTHALSLTFEPNVLQKTTTTQNDGNYLRISNFWLKNQISLKWVDFSPIYSCPRPKLKSLQLVPQWPNPKNGPNHLFLCQYPCFKEWGRSFGDIKTGLMYLLLMYPILKKLFLVNPKMGSIT